MVTSVGLLGYNRQEGEGCKYEGEAEQRESWEEWTSSNNRSASPMWSTSCSHSHIKLLVPTENSTLTSIKALRRSRRLEFREELSEMSER